MRKGFAQSRNDGEAGKAVLVTQGPPAKGLPDAEQMRNRPNIPAPKPTPQPSTRCGYRDTPCQASKGQVAPLAGSQQVSTWLGARLDPHNRIGEPGEDLYSGNFNWSLPLVSLPGRAGLDLGLALTYNSLVRAKDSSAQSIVFDPDTGFPSPGFRLGFPMIEWTNPSPFTGQAAYLLVLPSGRRVELRQVGSSSFYESYDSSYFQLEADTTAQVLKLRTADGTLLTYTPAPTYYRCTQVTDTNGNRVSISYTSVGNPNTITDTLGRVLSFAYDANNHLTDITQSWTVNGVAQTHNWAHFDYANLTINTSFSGLTVYGPANGTVIPVLTRVVTNDRARFVFVYNSWGQVNAIWQYGASDNQRNASVWNYNLGTLTDCPRFNSRQDWASDWLGTPDNPNAWVYTVFQFDQTDASGTFGKATNPEGTEQKEYFGTSGWQKGLNTRTETRAGGVLRRWTTTQWTQDNTSVSYPLNPRPTETNVYDEAGNRRRTTISYRTITLPGGTLCSLPQDVTEFKADAVTPLRTTHTDYQENVNYLTRRIIGLPTFRKLYEGGTTGALQAMTGYIYDEGGEFLQTITGAVTQFDPTAGGTYRGNVTTVRQYDVIQSGQKDQRIGYNNTGSVIFTRDPLGHQTDIAYTDSFSDGIARNTYAYPTKVTDPDGRAASPQFFSTTQYNYDFGAVTHTTDPKGAGVTYTWDVADTGRLFKVQNDVSQGYVRYVYDNSHTYLSVYTTIKDANTEYFAFQVFDGYGRQRGEISDHPGSSGGLKSTFRVFDRMGRVVQWSNPTEVNGGWSPVGDDAAGYVWSQQAYDWKGRPTVTTSQDGATRIASYDSCGCAGGEVVTLQDEGQVNQVSGQAVLQRRKTKIFHDVLGRETKRQLYDWSGNNVYSTTTTIYNVRDQATFIRQYQGDAPGDGSCLNCLETSQSYDGYGRVAYRKRPIEDAATSYSYDYDDRLVQVMDARGAVANFTYNGRDLTTDITYSGAAPTSPVHYEYDAAGNRTLMQMMDGTGSVAYHWNTISRMTSEDRQFPGLPGTYTLSYDYTTAGQVKRISFVSGPYPADNTDIYYDYDKAGQMTLVTGSPFSGVTQYANDLKYRAWGAVKSLAYGNGVNLSTSYNARLKTQSFEVARSGSPTMIKADYQYHADGRIRYAKDYRDSRFDRAFTYDQAGRIQESYAGSDARNYMSLPDPNPATPPYRQTYQYDVWGNQTGSSGKIWNTNYNSTDSYKPSGRWEGWQYDAAGNLLNDTKNQFSYDAAGRNVSITRIGSNPRSQWFDGDGLVVRQTDATQLPNPTIYYLPSTVLGGEVVIRLNGTNNGPGFLEVGRKVEERIYAGDTQMAVQTTNANGSTSVTWNHLNPVTNSRGSSRTDGVYFPTFEPDPLGTFVGFDPPSAPPPTPTDGGGAPAVFLFPVSDQQPFVKVLVDGVEESWSYAQRLLQMGAATHAPESTIIPVVWHGETTLARWQSFGDGYEGYVPFGACYGGDGVLTRCGRQQLYRAPHSGLRDNLAAINGAEPDYDLRRNSGWGGQQSGELPNIPQRDLPLILSLPQLSIPDPLHCGVNPITNTGGFTRTPHGIPGHFTRGTHGNPAFGSPRRGPNGPYPHRGLDISGLNGQDIVVANRAGRVIFTGNRGRAGNMIILDHGGGVTTRYLHLALIGVQGPHVTNGRLVLGEFVQQGLGIGIVGITGNAAADDPHLHFEVRYNGEAYDPETYLNSSCSEFPPLPPPPPPNIRRR
ncbi:MAG: peptidoglycan DD-metalloendopeptidase family protein [Blastocatellia bacterium]